MIRTRVALAVLVVAACTPQLTGPEAAVNAIYKPLADSRGATGTEFPDLPLTMNLALKIQELDTHAEERIFDFDLAGNCQDCTGFSSLKIATPTDPSLAARDGHFFVEATFTIAGDKQKAIFWDLMQVDGAWQVDNIFTEGFDLRLIVDDMLANQANPEPAVDLVQCMVMLQLHHRKLLKETPPGDIAANEAAYAGYRAQAIGEWTAEEVAHHLATTMDALAAAPSEQITNEANACIAAAPPAPPPQ